MRLFSPPSPPSQPSPRIEPAAGPAVPAVNTASANAGSNPSSVLPNKAAVVRDNSRDKFKLVFVPQGEPAPDLSKTMEPPAQAGLAAANAGQASDAHAVPASPEQALQHKRETLMTRLGRQGSPWLEMDMGSIANLRLCLRHGGQVVLDFILLHEADMPVLKGQLGILAEAAQSGSARFNQLATRTGLGFAYMPASKLALVRQVFDAAGETLKTAIGAQPGAFLALDAKQMRAAVSFDTLNGEVLALAARFPRLGKMKIEARRSLVAEIARGNPALSSYFKNKPGAWRDMNSAQMDQTVRAFAFGNPSHLKAIAAEKPGKQWSLTNPVTMKSANELAEGNVIDRRFKSLVWPGETYHASNHPGWNS